MTCFYSAIYFSTITQWVYNLDLCPAFYADKMVVTSWALQTRLFVQHLAGACIQDTLFLWMYLLVADPFPVFLVSLKM